MFQQPDGALRELGQEAALQGIELTGGYGPRPEHNLASADPEAVAAALDFYRVTFHKMQLAGIRSLGGALYSYWPVDYSRIPDKAGDWARSVAGMQRLAALAEDYGITLNMDCLLYTSTITISLSLTPISSASAGVIWIWRLATIRPSFSSTSPAGPLRVMGAEPARSPLSRTCLLYTSRCV